jgi:hypothetical protein
MEEDNPKKNNKDIEKIDLKEMDSSVQETIETIDTIDEEKTDKPIMKDESDEEKEEEKGEEDEESEEGDDEKVFLKLGQVIQFIAPNDSIDKQVYLIEYLDEQKMKLINVDDLNTLTLKIYDNEIVNVDIDHINILKNPDFDGYARQNNLVPHKWISITIGGDIPQIVNGEITDLENDEIQVTTWPEKQMLWINFDYKGIPPHIPILSILPIDKPNIKNIEDTEEESEEEKMKKVEGDEMIAKQTEEKSEESKEGIIEGEEESIESEYNVDDDDEDLLEEELEFLKDTEETHNKEELFIDINDIVLGESLGSIQEEVLVDEANKRYSINHQTEDLLNDMLSTVPTHKKTPYVLNKIHGDIERFKELRVGYLNFDEVGNVNNKEIIKNPTVEKIKNGEMVPWVLPVTRNIREIRDIEITDIDSFDDINAKLIEHDILEFQEINDQYYSNTIPDGKNKYEFLIQGMDKIQEVYSINPNKEAIIDNIHVNNSSAIVSNNLNGNFYSNMITDKKINEVKFNIDQYLSGYDMIYLPNLKVQNVPFQKKNIINNETYDLNGIIVLPSSIAEQHKLSLPYTNLYDKINLSNVISPYSEILQNSTSMKNIELNETSLINNEHVYDYSYNYYNTYSFELQEKMSYDDRDVNILNNFLHASLPNNKNIMNSISKNSKYNNEFILNIEDLQYKLEPFNIYHDHFNYNSIDIIENIINEHILLFKQENTRSTRFIQNYLNQTKSIGISKSSSVFFSLFPAENDQFSKVKEIFNAIYYNVNEKTNKYEIIRNILEDDNGVLLFNAMSLSELSLFQTMDVDSFIEDDLNEIEQNLKDKDKQDECSNSIFLVKRYEDIDELNEDDYNVNLKADKKYYNHIDFDIGISWKENNPTIDDEKTMVKKLTDYLLKNLKVKSANALRDAETMIYGFMKVKDGDYALLDYGEERKYYERNNNKWLLKEEYDNKLIEEINFCNMKDKCMKVKNTCNNMETNKDLINQRLLNEINDTFKDKMRLSIEDLKKSLVNKLNYNLENIKKIKDIQEKKYLQNNKIKYNLGFEYEDLQIIVSPNAKLRDIILSDNDMVTKFFNIIKFVEKFCRTFTNEENEHWYYCNETDTPLLPTFFLELASGFNGNRYKETLDKICKDRGVLSNDGDKFVDKHSGYYITEVELSTDEGYTEDGFKINTKEVLEEDILETFEKIADDSLISIEYKYKTELSISIKNVLDNLDKLLNISTVQEHDFIIKLISQYILENLNEKEYKKKIKKMKDKKKLPSYEKQRDQLMLYAIAVMYCIAIQVHTPSISKKYSNNPNVKTLKNCVKSFNGYPLESNDDMSMVRYIVCAILKMKTKKNRPYNALPKSTKTNANEVIDKITSKLKAKLFPKFLELYEVKDKIKDKKLWDLKHKEIETVISEHFSLDSWNTFLPPLKQITLKSISGLGTVFEKNLKNYITRGNYEHFRQTMFLYGKMMFFTFSIRNSIQNIVDKNDLVLFTNDKVYYQENACCNEDIKNTLEYFTAKESVILRHNEQVKKITTIMTEYKRLSQPLYLFFKDDTRIPIPELNDIFSEETIYLFFIKNCKFNSDAVLPNNITNICVNNQSSFLASDNLKEKINTLKQENKNYNQESLKELLAIINRQNIIHLDMELPIVTGASYFEENLKVLQNKTPLHLPSTDILNTLEELVDRYDTTYTEETDNVVDNLLEHIKEHNEEVLDNMLELLKKVTKTKKIKEFYKGLLQWKKRGENLYMDLNDETDFNVFHLLKTMVINLIQIYPTILSKKSNIQSTINKSQILTPYHWGISLKHAQDVVNFIKNEYKPFDNNFYLNENIIPILSFVLNKNEDIMRLIKCIPFYSNMELDENNSYKSIFNGNNVKHINAYLLFASFQLYIDYLDESEEFIDVNLQQETSAIMGERELKEKNVAELLLAYTKILMNYKKLLNFSNDEVLNGINKSKSKEKYKITQNFKNMTEESRRIEDIKKNLSLGEWSIGQSRAIFEYQADDYDKARMAMEQDMIIEGSAKNIDEVSTMHDFIYNLEHVEEQMIAKRIEDEAYGLHTMLPDDDDYGDMDGDEYY